MVYKFHPTSYHFPFSIERADAGAPVSALGRTEAMASEKKRGDRRGAQVLWAVGGFASFGLGALGAVLPVLPTVPFMLAAAFCFARSSKRLDAWFHTTKLYRTVLEGFVMRRAMTVKAKLLLLGPVTLVFGLSFLLMPQVPIGRAAVVAVWVAHVVYFGFIVKTERRAAPDGESGDACEREQIASELRLSERTEG